MIQTIIILVVLYLVWNYWLSYIVKDWFQGVVDRATDPSSPIRKKRWWHK